MLEVEERENPPLEVGRGVCPGVGVVAGELKRACG
jgi:hypothetical protein